MSKLTPAEWAEKHRVPSELPIEPKFTYEKTPYIKDITDSLKLTSDRKIVVFKGESLGLSTGIIENKAGWNLEGVPINLFLNQLDEMIDSSGLRPLARPKTKEY